MFVLRLCGAADEPGSLVLTSKDRKRWSRPDSRYQNFLRATFARTVLFSGFDPRRPRLHRAARDVGRGFSGHVPPTWRSCPREHRPVHRAAHLDALRHHARGNTPPELSPADALAEVATLLEELEVPNPRRQPAARLHRTEHGLPQHPCPPPTQTGSTSSIAATSCRGARSRPPPTRRAGGRPDPGVPGRHGRAGQKKTKIALVRGRQGEGKTRCCAASLDLAADGRRVFWREFGAGGPDRYVRRRREGHRRLRRDDADELDNLPSL